MKLFLTLASCLALVGVAFSAQFDDPNNPKKKKNANQNQQQQVQQQQQIKQQQKGLKHQQNQQFQQQQQLQHQQNQQQKMLKHQQNQQDQFQQHQQHQQLHQEQHEQHLQDKQAKHEIHQQEHLEKHQLHQANKQYHIQHFQQQFGPKQNIQSVKFNKGYKIQNSWKWNGPKYVVFKNYHPDWHDQGWWHSHYPRVVLISGGWYYWNDNYWYPAWGYDPGASYYPYDGPIYAYNDLPPDQVIANVQEVLADQGYYQSDVDGLLGPITRAALADYQRDHDLEQTGAIDEPTLDTMGIS